MKVWRKIVRILLIVFLIFIVSGLDCRMKVRKYTLTSDKLSSTVKMVLITDLHSCNYGKGERRIVKQIDKFNPDMILLGGDIYDDLQPMDITTDFLNDIGRRYRCYYTTGNHEVKSGNLDTIKKMILASGVKILEKECTTVSHGKDSINICGVPDVTELKIWRNVWESVDSLSKAGNGKYYTILLHHRPELIERFMESPYDLVTAGHYHGGQFKLPWMKEGVYAPDHSGTLKYTGGLYRFGKRNVIVSRGLARESTRIPRFFNRPELVLITVNPSETKTQSGE